MNDIGDIETVDLSALSIPEGSGFAAFLSLPGTTNRTLVFDFRPLDSEWEGGPFDPGGLLAAGLTHVIFRAQASLSDAEWRSLIEQGWFPFMCLDVATVHLMIKTIRAGSSVDDILQNILDNVRVLVPEIRAFITTHAIYERHRTLLLQALSAYERGEYAIATTALIPRMEGIIREYYAREGGRPAGKYIKDKHLLDAVAKRSTRNPLSLLEPKRFAEFLGEVMFSFESFGDPSAVKRVTRHSVAHGVAHAEMLDEKFAALALLSLYQSGVMAIDGNLAT